MDDKTYISMWQQLRKSTMKPLNSDMTMLYKMYKMVHRCKYTPLYMYIVTVGFNILVIGIQLWGQLVGTMYITEWSPGMECLGGVLAWSLGVKFCYTFSEVLLRHLLVSMQLLYNLFVYVTSLMTLLMQKLDFMTFSFEFVVISSNWYIFITITKFRFCLNWVTQYISVLYVIIISWCSLYIINYIVIL